MKFPEVPKVLLDKLEDMFPDKALREDVGSFSFGVNAGQQNVLDILRHHYNKQQETKHV
jgi:hypothetical protein